MMNPEEKPAAQPGNATTGHRQPGHQSAADSAFEFKQIRVIKPLRLTDEDPGSDPYNRTGRFTTDD